MGRLHPHGDSAIYDALVRMAQPFSLRLPLIDGHGNFGSLDDGPAAMRYTECRLAPAAETVTTGLNEDVVDYVANYDGRELEPVVLPASVPPAPGEWRSRNRRWNGDQHATPQSRRGLRRGQTPPYVSPQQPR